MESHPEEPKLKSCTFLVASSKLTYSGDVRGCTSKVDSSEAIKPHLNGVFF